MQISPGMGFFRHGNVTKRGLDEAINEIRAQNEAACDALLVEHISDAQEVIKLAEKVGYSIESYKLFLQEAVQASKKKDYNEVIEMIKEAQRMNEKIAKSFDYLKERDQRLK